MNDVTNHCDGICIHLHCVAYMKVADMNVAYMHALTSCCIYEWGDISAWQIIAMVCAHANASCRIYECRVYAYRTCECITYECCINKNVDIVSRVWMRWRHCVTKHYAGVWLQTPLVACTNVATNVASRHSYMQQEASAQCFVRRYTYEWVKKNKKITQRLRNVSWGVCVIFHMQWYQRNVHTYIHTYVHTYIVIPA